MRVDALVDRNHDGVSTVVIFIFGFEKIAFHLIEVKRIARSGLLKHNRLLANANR
ncbi:hypothetical protein D3C73_1611430 [compost metagenome]